MTKTQFRIEMRVLQEARYIIENECTIRECGKYMKVGKSTVHIDMMKRLPEVNMELYKEVKRVIDVNKEERYKRGGNATKEKYLFLNKIVNK